MNENLDLKFPQNSPERELLEALKAQFKKVEIRIIKVGDKNEAAKLDEMADRYFKFLDQAVEKAKLGEDDEVIAEITREVEKVGDMFRGGARDTEELERLLEKVKEMGLYGSHVVVEEKITSGHYETPKIPKEEVDALFEGEHKENGFVDPKSMISDLDEE